MSRRASRDSYVVQHHIARAKRRQTGPPRGPPRAAPGTLFQLMLEDRPRRGKEAEKVPWRLPPPRNPHAARPCESRAGRITQDREFRREPPRVCICAGEAAEVFGVAGGFRLLAQDGGQSLEICLARGGRAGLEIVVVVRSYSKPHVVHRAPRAGEFASQRNCKSGAGEPPV